MLRNKILPVFVLVCLSLIPILIVLNIKHNVKCNQHIVLDDNTQYDCKAVSSFENGITYIDLCNGDEIRVPTRRIKMVTNIKE
jgi:hypothetical protein